MNLFSIETLKWVTNQFDLDLILKFRNLDEPVFLLAYSIIDLIAYIKLICDTLFVFFFTLKNVET